MPSRPPKSVEEELDTFVEPPPVAVQTKITVKLLIYSLWGGKRLVYEVADPRHVWAVPPDNVQYTVDPQSIDFSKLMDVDALHVPDHIPATPSAIREYILTP